MSEASSTRRFKGQPSRFMLTTLARTLRFNSDGASVTSFEGLDA